MSNLQRETRKNTEEDKRLDAYLTDKRAMLRFVSMQSKIMTVMGIVMRILQKEDYGDEMQIYPRYPYAGYPTISIQTKKLRNNWDFVINLIPKTLADNPKKK